MVIEVKMVAWFVPLWCRTVDIEHLELKECFHKCTKCDCNVSLYVCSWWSRWSCNVPPVVGHAGRNHAVKWDRENQEHPSPLQFHQLSEPPNKDAGETRGKETRGEGRWAKRTGASFPLMNVAADLDGDQLRCVQRHRARFYIVDWLHTRLHVWCYCRFKTIRIMF